MPVRSLAEKLGISTRELFRRALEAHGPNHSRKYGIESDHAWWLKNDTVPDYVRAFCKEAAA